MLRTLLFGSTGVALMLSGAAFAMPQVPIIPLDTTPGQDYVTVDGQWSQVPKDNFHWLKDCSVGETTLNSDVRGGGYCGDSEPFLDASHTFDSWGGGGILGFTMEKPWMGDRQRFEIGVAALTGDRDDSRADEPLPAPAVSANSFIGGYLDMEAKAHTSYDAYAVVERTLFDFDVSSNFTITPNVGVVFRHTREDVHADGSWYSYGYGGEGIERINQIGFTTLADRNQLLTTSEIGLELGTTASYDLSRAFKLFAGVNAEFLHRSGEFKGQDCFRHEYLEVLDSSSSSACSGEVQQMLYGGGSHSSHTAIRESDFAVNVTLSAGVSYSFPGGTTISLIGYAQNEDNLVVADNDHHQMEDFGPMSGHDGQHLESRRDWVPGAVIALTVPFGGS